MRADILKYNAAQSAGYKSLCNQLARALDAGLPGAETKVWHGGPVWFIEENPIVGYWVRKESLMLLFWSGQSFDEPKLLPEGKFKAAEVRLTEDERLGERDLKRWLRKARTIQWDYKNIVKRRGVRGRTRNTVVRGAQESVSRQVAARR